MQYLQRLAERCERIAARNPGLPAEGIERTVRSGERAGMAACGARRPLGAARLDQRDGLARGPGLGNGPCEPRDILDTFDIEAERADARVIHQAVDQMFDSQAGLVAGGEEIADGERALIEEEIERDGAALADERHPACGFAADH